MTSRMFTFGVRWNAVLLLGLAGAVAYMVVPYSATTELILYDGVVALALIASVLGSRRSEARERRVWGLTSLALGGFLVGELTWWAYSAAGQDPFPSIADAVFLVSYLPLGLAAAAIVRAREGERDRSAWLDAGILTAVAGLVVWDTLIAKYVSDPEIDGISLAATIAYPLVDLLVLGLVLRLVFSRNARSASSTALAAGVVLMLAADLVFAWQDLAGNFQPGSYLDLLWLLSYLLIGFAPHHGSPRRAAERRAGAGTGRLRLALVLVAVTVPQVVLAGKLSELDLGALDTVTVAVFVSTAVLILVALRLWSLTERARRAEARRGEERLAALINHSEDAIFLVDTEHSIGFASRRSAVIAGRDPDALLGTSLLDLVLDESRSSIVRQLGNLAGMPTGSTVPIEARVSLADDTSRVVEGTGCNLLDDENVRAIVVTVRDVTSRRELEEQLERQAFHDELTGLANRALFADRVAHALDRSARDRAAGVAILFVDLDDFKAVNDGMGHTAGDELIRGVAGRIRACVRPADTVARLGGDEFAVLLEDVPSLEYAAGVAERLLEVLQLPIDVSGVSLAVPSSVGVTLATNDSTVESLLRDADIAMYSAKAQGKGRIALFDESLRNMAIERLSLKIELPEALRTGQFQLAYQPIRHILGHDLTGFEALIRWHHPTRGVIAPADFIPAAEETGAIVEIGRWVLEQACRQAAAWNERGTRPLSISVNVSGVQLHHPGFVDDLRRVLETTGLPASLLVLEITESVLVDHQSVTATLEELRDIGVGIAIDDFGTGYSSLSYLKQFPVTSIKVDRSFVADLSGRGDTGLVASIMSIAGALGLTTVAEGVETDEQLEALDGLDCNLAQGFFLGRPQTAEQVDDILHERAQRRDGATAGDDDWPLAAGL